MAIKYTGNSERNIQEARPKFTGIDKQFVHELTNNLYRNCNQKIQELADEIYGKW